MKKHISKNHICFVTKHVPHTLMRILHLCLLKLYATVQRLLALLALRDNMELETAEVIVRTEIIWVFNRDALHLQLEGSYVRELHRVAIAKAATQLRAKGREGCTYVSRRQCRTVLDALCESVKINNLIVAYLCHISILGICYAITALHHSISHNSIMYCFSDIIKSTFTPTKLRIIIEKPTCQPPFTPLFYNSLRPKPIERLKIMAKILKIMAKIQEIIAIIL